MLREGDQNVFRKVFDEYHGRVYAYIYKKTRSAYIAEEAMQLTFVKLWKYRRSLKPEFKLSTHVFRIAGTTMIDLVRSEQHKRHLLQGLKPQPDADADGSADSAGSVEEHELRQRVHVLVRQMPEMQKKVFEMSRFEEKSHREIATALSISVKTVENHISRALKFLRQHLNLLHFLL